MHFSKDDIHAMSQSDFFGPGNAQLPSDNMLMIDKITDINQEGGLYQRGELKASFKIHSSQWFFACHFKGDPVMPGCLGLDALWQLLGVYLGWQGLAGRGRALGVGQVKFTGQIYPDSEQIDYHIHIKRVFRKPMPMGIADGFVFKAGEKIYEAKDLRVGLIKAGQ
ncbi:bifunctional 3-hydroxydecanoyl-ACP dehydratase/trans-2-decenoyl-ACP isomerase [Agaribacterium sp. ZY112]|uniref:bifunctional 3-hydroxydecanoyl-ACP dehydratase/trans-2-decenoyl-ACP isomerase n=1 Tax=Agaribacterium sp. ZY112 TaxID=3233574 RepID=UPI00352636B0